MITCDRLKMTGPIWVEEFDAPAPGNPKKTPYLDPEVSLDGQVWTENNRARIIYDKENNMIYFGDSIRNKFRTLNDIPRNKKILFETDTQQLGYTLLTTVTDGVVYFTSGSGAGGEAGNTAKIAGTWTSPTHTHDLSDHQHTTDVHDHTMNHSHSGALTHSHTTASHTITISEMAVHTHLSPPEGNFAKAGGGAGRGGNKRGNRPTTGPAGGGSSHTHGNTLEATIFLNTFFGSTNIQPSGLTSNSGVGTTTSNYSFQDGITTWRPVGRNLTRQRRN